MELGPVLFVIWQEICVAELHTLVDILRPVTSVGVTKNSEHVKKMELPSSSCGSESDPKLLSWP
eukprot:4012336-Ditylum_brightwellii.AAC.1